jgi:hypothetical protein
MNQNSNRIISRYTYVWYVSERLFFMKNETKKTQFFLSPVSAKSASNFLPVFIFLTILSLLRNYLANYSAARGPDRAKFSPLGNCILLVFFKL